MKKLFLSLTLLLASSAQVNAFDFNSLKEALGFGQTVVAPVNPTFTEKVKNAVASVYAAGKAQATKLSNVSPRASFVALAEKAKNNPAYAAGAVVATVAGVWVLNETYRYFVPKKEAQA